MMYTLLGIHDYYNHTKDADAKYLFDQGLLVLKKHLPLYDYGKYSYSYYDALKTTNPLRFHKIHIDLLSQLYNITKEPLFKVYHDRWENYTPPAKS